MAAPAIPPIRLGVIGTGLAVEKLHWPALRRLADRYVVTAFTDRSAEQSRRFADYSVAGSSPGRRRPGCVAGPRRRGRRADLGADSALVRGGARRAHGRQGRALREADRRRRGAGRGLPRTGGRASGPHLRGGRELLLPRQPALRPRIARRRRDRSPAPDGVAARRPARAPRGQVHRHAVAAAAAVPRRRAPRRRRAPHRPDLAALRRHRAGARCRAGGQQHDGRTVGPRAQLRLHRRRHRQLHRVLPRDPSAARTQRHAAVRHRGRARARRIRVGAPRDAQQLRRHHPHDSLPRYRQGLPRGVRRLRRCRAVRSAVGRQRCAERGQRDGRPAGSRLRGTGGRTGARPRARRGPGTAVRPRGSTGLFDGLPGQRISSSASFAA